MQYVDKLVKKLKMYCLFSQFSLNESTGLVYHILYWSRNASMFNLRAFIHDHDMTSHEQFLLRRD